MSKNLPGKKSVAGTTRSALNHNKKKTSAPDAVEIAIDKAPQAPQVSANAIQYIDVEQIIPRSINNYKQGQIEKLAKSIRATNNRLINPITLAKIEDYSEKSEVIAAYKNKQISLDGFTYVIVAGERRYRAWLMLREEAKQNGGLSLFDTIPAIVLDKAAMRKENAYYNDSNLQARHISPIEILLNSKDVFSKIVKDEDKKAALIEMNAAGVDENTPADKAAKLYVKERYAKFYLEKNFGIVDWSDSTIKTALWVLDKCDQSVIDAILADEFNTKQAKRIASYPADIQCQLLDLWKENKILYEERLDALQTAEEDAKENSKVVSYRKREITSELKATRKTIEKRKDKFEEMLSAVSPQNQKAIKDAIKSCDKLIGDLNIIIDGIK